MELILDENNAEVDPFSVVSLFAGAGGLDMGFHNKGFHIKWANDIDADACSTHRLWSDAEVVQGDIGKIDVDKIPRSGVIIGGFPCQGFSLAGPRKINDERNGLYRFFVNLVEKKKPYMFVAENVKGILTLGDGLILEAIKDDFTARGYNVFVQLVNAADYGVPQERWRVIFMGFRDDLVIEDFKFPQPHSTRTSMRAVLEKLPDPGSEDVSKDGYSSRYMSRNRKRGWDDVSFTIPAMAKQIALHPSSPDMIKLGPDKWVFGEGESRRLSWQEAAAIQTFPPDMEFAGSLTSKYRQIGNAVPVKLAEVVAEIARHYIEVNLEYGKDIMQTMAEQTKRGKSFEYACLKAIERDASRVQKVVVDRSLAFDKAKAFYEGVSAEQRQILDKAADAASKFLSRYEPMLVNETCSPLHVCIQEDKKGQEGDVRDVVCYKESENWSIGLSCKHNHNAAKHSRLSPTIDFGELWFDCPCSSDYFNEINPIFDRLNDLKKEDANWEDVDDKEATIYAPILESFRKEMDRLKESCPEIAEKFVRYMIGDHDFYKVISMESHCVTEVIPYNLSETLNQSAGKRKSSSRFGKMEYPTKIICMEPKGNNTIIVVCDRGWSFSLRIHSAKKKVETSLKFDVQIISNPASAGKIILPWD